MLARLLNIPEPNALSFLLFLDRSVENDLLRRRRRPRGKSENVLRPYAVWVYAGEQWLRGTLAGKPANLPCNYCASA